MGQYDQGCAYPPQGGMVIGQPVNFQNAQALDLQQSQSYEQPQGYQQQASYQHQGYQGGPPLVLQNAPLQVVTVAHKGKWTTGLCGCCCDCNDCCLTFWCPCIAFGQIAEVVDDGQSSCCIHAVIYALLLSVGVPCIYSCMWRQKLRNKYRLEPGCCGDFGTHCICECCALCQEHRELRNRGLDPSLGWEANRANYVQPMAVPTPPGVMLR